MGPSLFFGTARSRRDSVSDIARMDGVTEKRQSARINARSVIVRYGVQIATIALFVTSFALYLSTMAPGLTWENEGGDGGDFLAAAHTWGIPHPTGYPTYLVALRSFSEILPIGDEAFRGNLFSAFTGSLAVGVFFLAARKMLLRLPLSDTKGTAIPFSVAIIASLAFATSNLHWSQSTITEVYALNALFVCAAIWLSLRVRARMDRGEPTLKARFAMAFLLGIAFGNHVTIGFVALPLAIWIYWPWLSERSWRPLVKEWQPPVALLAGLAIYLYSPIASSQDPALNWFFPDSFSGFNSMISATIYQPYVFGLSRDFIDDRVVFSFDLWLTQFTAVGAILGLAGVMFLWSRMKGFAIATIATSIALTVYTIAYNSFDAYVFLVPAFIVFALWIAAGLMNLASITVDAVQKSRTNIASRYHAYAVPAVLGVALIAMPIWSLVFNFAGTDISDDTEASDYVESALRTAGQGSIIITEDIPTFGLWYQSLVAEPEQDVAVIAAFLINFDWYWDHIMRQFPERIPDAEGLSRFQRIRAIGSHNLGKSDVFITHPESGYASQFQLREVDELWLVEE